MREFVNAIYVAYTVKKRTRYMMALLYGGKTMLEKTSFRRQLLS